MSKKWWSILGGVVILIALFAFQPMALNRIYHEELNYDVLMSDNQKLKTTFIKQKMLQVLEKIYVKPFSDATYTVDVYKEDGKGKTWVAIVSQDKEKYQLTMDLETFKVTKLEVDKFQDFEQTSNLDLEKIAIAFWKLPEVGMSQGILKLDLENPESTNQTFFVENENHETLAVFELNKGTGQVVRYDKAESRQKV